MNPLYVQHMSQKWTEMLILPLSFFTISSSHGLTQPKTSF